jgi:catechol 2,3-dioxygenase-like lactoylglutathione lyase family enzyme
MLTVVGQISILVRDAEKAANWYQEKLGFEIVGKEEHAVFVRPKGTTFPLIHLCAGPDAWAGDKPGGKVGVWLACGAITFGKGHPIPSSDPAEVERTYRELKDRGVEFTEELQKASWGTSAVFRDLDGNEFEIS